MSNMKCPFCQQELDTGNYFVHCHNPHCDITEEMEGTEEMWEALIRTRKALDVAVDALKEISLRYSAERNAPESVWTIAAIDMAEYADNALDKITTLEQKD